MKKKPREKPDDDLRSEYDFSKMEGGISGKYAERFRTGTNVVLLEPDVAEAFSDDRAVNEALRSFIKRAKE